MKQFALPKTNLRQSAATPEELNSIFRTLECACAHRSTTGGSDRRPKETTLPVQARSGRSHSSCSKYMSGLLTDIAIVVIIIITTVVVVVEAQTVPLERSLCTLCGRLLQLPVA